MTFADSELVAFAGWMSPAKAGVSKPCPLLITSCPFWGADDDAAVRSRQQHRAGHDPSTAPPGGKLITTLPAFQSSNIAGDRSLVDAPMRASCES